jgi:hypothetical protein
MQLFSRIVGVLLLAGLAASSAGARAFTLPAAQNTPPAGCHGHGLPPRAPAPLSHQCCIAGHDHAFPGSVFSGITLLPYCGAAGDAEQAAPAYRFIRRLSIPLPSSPGSPGSSCLRI